MKNFFRKLFRKEKKPEIEVRETRHADGSYDRAIIDNKNKTVEIHRFDKEGNCTERVYGRIG